jgi:hypothetical protein
MHSARENIPNCVISNICKKYGWFVGDEGRLGTGSANAVH